MSWNEIGGASASETKKVSFLTFPEGVTHIRALDSEPFSRWVHWIPSAKRSVTCLGKGCPICELIATAKAKGEKAPFNSSKKHSINVLNRTSGQVEIVEQGNNFWEDVRICFEDNGDITKYDMKVRRTGKGMNDTKYRVDALPESELTTEEQALVESDARVLAEYFAPHTAEQLVRLASGEDPKTVFSAQEDINLS